ncbi:peptidase inhibitor family I36 protein [Streptomyces sp. NPDC004126]|uniref:peptidase inhibitor family I36 protein n=1 Tax=Streptomyces sp. NPDC004126 TaxID=3390695 RepID=UPI003CFE5A9F
MALRTAFRSGTSAKAVAALAMTAAALLAAPGAAGAATGADGGPAGFAAQARAAGLDGAQAKGLQKRVDSYLAKEAGTQVAANKITLAGGGEILLALPGEKYARELGTSQPTAATAAANCAYTYVCAYSGTWFSGDKKSFYTCNTLNSIPWSGTGSWINNQRPELRARFYDVNKNVGWISPGGYSEDGEAPWGWVYYLSPC